MHKIFIIYEILEKQLENFLKMLDVEAEKVTNDSGMTIIESLESKLHNISVGIVLLTLDDRAISKADFDKGNENYHLQARQNVVLEMGMLMAKLGRKNVIILEKGDIKGPSDIRGIFHLDLRNIL
ncbi:nucleotide-binding protein [Helicobacter cetorum]|uniref:CD-NTase-associated protein 12/Pycsar effector protein TIR domain-containing protein n=1 Tax=Helicobacter cetorum (strain ATCC BAA-540 / CCUG 52418 / MIT 99-5656) TaxID=1163745 RepID=I0ERA3_HELCM|nr:nucleotide-binding protein [Helicobacter cetorum]AFI05472.1 hypothetical protein HCD_02250 [Helicobacter cetorum MIT 99-5656]